MASKSGKHEVLVGVAIGGRSLSACFLLPGKNQQPTPVAAWPGAKDVKNLSVPLLLEYQSYPPTDESNASAWGYMARSVRSTENNILLKRAQQLGSFHAPLILHEIDTREGNLGVAIDIPNGGRTPLENFLVLAKAHIADTVGNAFGFDKDQLERLQCRFCFSVPPWLSKNDRDTLRQSCEEDLEAPTEIICDSTAALAYFLSKSKNPTLQSADIFLHCNLDETHTTISVYSVDERSPRLQLTAISCQVLTCGAVDVANAFREVVEDSLCSFLEDIEVEATIVTERLDEIVELFVKSLPKLDGVKEYRPRLPWDVPPQMVGPVRINRTEMVIDSVTLREKVFKPYLQQVYNILAQESARTREKSHFLITGTMSECPYVTRYFEQTISDKNLKSAITVLRSVNGETAASRGAAMHIDHSRKGYPLNPLAPATSSVSIVASLTPESRSSILSRRVNETSSKILNHLQTRQPLSEEEKLATQKSLRALDWLMHEESCRFSFNSDISAILSTRVRIKEGLGVDADVVRETRTMFETAFSDRHVITLQEFHSDVEILHLVAMLEGPSALDFLVLTGSDLNTRSQARNFHLYTPLHCASHYGNLAATSWLLENGADIGARTKMGQTCLHLAMSAAVRLESQDADDLVTLLIETLASSQDLLNAENLEGQTGFDLAKAAAREDWVKLLAEKGVRENSKIEGAIADAIHAANEGDTNRLSLLVNLPANRFLFQQLTEENDGLLHIVAQNGDMASLSLLLSNPDADSNLPNGQGETALHIAVSTRRQDLVTLLLQHNPNATLPDAEDLSPIHRAALAGATGIFRSIMQATHPDTMQKCWRTSKGAWTPLHLAVERGCTDLVSFILLNQPSRDQVEAQSNESYGWARREKSAGGVMSAVGVFSFQRTRHPENKTNCGGWRPLHIAALTGNLEIVRLLVDYGAKIDAKDIEGLTPMDRAASNGHVEVVKVFLELMPPQRQLQLPIRPPPPPSPLRVPGVEPGQPKKQGFMKRMFKSKGKEATGGLSARVTATPKSPSPPPPPPAPASTTLIAAIEGGQDLIVHLLLSYSVSPSGQDPKNGWAPVSYAAACGRGSILSTLLQAGASPSVIHSDLSTPLHLAAGNLNSSALRQLLQSNTVPQLPTTARDGEGNTLFHFAARSAAAETVWLLVEYAKRDVDTRNKNGKTPLHVAAEHGNAAVAEALVDMDVEIHARDSEGRTAVHIAAAGGDLPMMKLLCGRSSSLLYEEDAKGRNVFHYAACGDNFLEEDGRSAFAVLRSLADADGRNSAYHQPSSIDGFTPLLLAVRYGRKRLIENILRPNFVGLNFLSGRVDSDCLAPLHIAAKFGQADTARLLLSLGAKVNGPTQKGATPLHFAADGLGKDSKYHETQVADVLIQYGADINAAVEDGRTPLHFAANSTNGELLQLLIAHGAEASLIHRDSKGETPLHKAVNKNWTEGVVCLSQLPSASRIDLLAKNVYPPLHSAAKVGNIAVMELLLDREPKVLDLQDPSYGTTALIAAASRFETEAVKYLLGRGADPTIRSLENLSALDATLRSLKNLSAVEITEAARARETVTLLLGNTSANASIRQEEAWAALEQSSDNMEVFRSIYQGSGCPNDNGAAALHHAVRDQRPNLLRALLRIGVNPRIPNEDGWTPLHTIVMEGTPDHWHLAGMLIAQGASIDDGGDRNRTPLHQAALLNKPEMMRVLLQKGANPECADETGNLPIHLAAEYGSPEVLGQLSSNMASLRAKNSKGKTPIDLAVASNHGPTIRHLLDREKSVQKGTTALHTAASTGNSDAIRTLLLNGAVLDSRDADWQTPLMLAVVQHKEDAIRELLHHGANVHAAREDDACAMTFAVERGYHNTAKLLLTAGADVDSRAGIGTCLHIATEHGHIDMVQLLLDHGADIRAKTKEYGMSALHVAVKFVRSDIISLLIARGLPIDVGCGDDATPLMYAIINSNESFTLKLLSMGADIKRKDKFNKSAIHYAAIHAGESILRTLMRRGANVHEKGEQGWAPLHEAAGAGMLDNMQTLMRAGADELSRSDDQHLPLHRACRAGHVEAAKVFLEMGINVDIPDGEGLTPLAFTTFLGKDSQDKIVRFLVDEYRAKIEYRDNFGNTVLANAARGGSMVVFRTLLDYGARLDTRSDQQWTLLHHAASKNQADILELLLEYAPYQLQCVTQRGFAPIHEAAADGSLATLKILCDHPRSNPMVFTQFEFQNTALHVAASNGQVECITYLIETVRIPVDIPNNKGHSPLNHAAEEGQSEAILCLIQHGASVNYMHNDGFSPLKDAARWNRPEAIRMLAAHGAMVSLADAQYRQTPLHIAALHGCVEAIDVLRDVGAWLEARNYGDHTPLNLASSEGKVASVERLLTPRGGYVADIEAVIHPGAFSSIMLASQEGRLEVVQALVARGANAYRQNAWGEDSLTIARNHGHHQIANYLQGHARFQGRFFRR